MQLHIKNYLEIREKTIKQIQNPIADRLNFWIQTSQQDTKEIRDFVKTLPLNHLIAFLDTLNFFLLTHFQNRHLEPLEEFIPKEMIPHVIQYSYETNCSILDFNPIPSFFLHLERVNAKYCLTYEQLTSLPQRSIESLTFGPFQKFTGFNFSGFINLQKLYLRTAITADLFLSLPKKNLKSLMFGEKQNFHGFDFSQLTALEGLYLNSSITVVIFI